MAGAYDSAFGSNPAPDDIWTDEEVYGDSGPHC